MKRLLTCLLFLLLTSPASSATSATLSLRAGTTQTITLLDASGRPFALLQPFCDVTRGFAVLTLDGAPVAGVWLPAMQAPIMWDYAKRAREAREARQAAIDATPRKATRESVSNTGMVHREGCRYFDGKKAVPVGRTKGKKQCSVCEDK
jgi:hypothetical protein